VSSNAPIEAHDFDLLYGLVLTECSEETVRAQVLVREELRQRGDVVHGGVYAAIADALAARGTAAAIGDGKVALAIVNHTHVLHPIAEGTIHATAVRRHRGRTTWVWEVEMGDDAGRRCVVARVTIAVKAAQDDHGAGGA
jgi:uncharacterized protein (TIGR00369 family)